MPRSRQNRDLFHARDERSGKTLRSHRHHSRRPVARRRNARRSAAAIQQARSGRYLRRGRGTVSLRNIGIVYRKELIDSLRDQRTLISMIAVPLLLVPFLTIGLLVVTFRQVGEASEEVPKVMILVGEDLPNVRAELAKLRCAESLPQKPAYAG